MTDILGNELLRGSKVYLNRITRADLPALTAQWQDPEFLRYVSRRPAMPYTLEDFEDWYKKMNDPNAPTFAIRALDDHALLGMTAFKGLRWAARHTFFWIGISAPGQQGKGYGTDAVLVLLKYAFLELNLNCVALEAFSYNERALAMYRKIGFTQDGAMRALLYRDGAYYDQIVMSMLRSEWEDRYGQQARSGAP